MIRHRDAADRRERVISSGDENNIALLASDKFLNADLLTQEDLRRLECLLSSTDATCLVSLQEPSNECKPLLMKLAAHYLTVETHHGRPLCPVAKFHIRNGAEMYRLNYLGDTTSKGLRNSCGIMINYRYLLDELEENHVNYERTGKIAVSDGVKCWIVERSSS
jgi:malonyl-CoA decarboxylase